MLMRAVNAEPLARGLGSQANPQYLEISEILRFSTYFSLNSDDICDDETPITKISVGIVSPSHLGESI